MASKRGRRRRARGRLRALAGGLAKARDEVGRLQGLLDRQPQLEALKGIVRKLPPYGYGPQYVMQVSWNPEVLRHGLLGSRRDWDVVNLSVEVRYLVEELAYRVERELVKQLAADRMLK